jgi:deoxyribose-phosphate aldolase
MTLVGGTALAQQPVVQPAQEQSAEPMQRDMVDCQGIVKQSTGYDPAQATTQAAAPMQPQAGGCTRGAAAGAVAAAVKGQL